MVDETLKQFFRTRASFGAGRRLESSPIVTQLYRMTLLNPSKAAPIFVNSIYNP